jgi:hypothetical protein
MCSLYNEPFWCSILALLIIKLILSLDIYKMYYKRPYRSKVRIAIQATLTIVVSMLATYLCVSAYNWSFDRHDINILMLNLWCAMAGSIVMYFALDSYYSEAGLP